MNKPVQLPLLTPQAGTPLWEMRVSRRARRLSMRVFPGGRVEVVVPPGIGMRAVETFVARHRDWAERRVRELATDLPTLEGRRPSLVRLGLIERHWQVQYSIGRRRRMACEDLGDGRLEVRVPSDDERQIGTALLRWLGETAAEQLQPRLRSLAEETGIGFERMQLRRQRTRWGSCSSRGTISLNLCLLFQRPAVARYLMVHELCHRRHMNHSAPFWRLVESFEPEWRALDAELLRGWRAVPAWVFP